MSKTIPLSQGKLTIVDDGDYEWLSQWRWRWLPSSTGPGYAIRSVRENGRGIAVYMHREILRPPPGMHTDHINSDGLDNRRINLRVCTRSQNQMNARKHTAGSSRYKGVSYHKHTGKWRAHIMIDRTFHYLGLFPDEDEAARAYDAQAKVLFGDFARLNNPPPIRTEKEERNG